MGRYSDTTNEFGQYASSFVTNEPGTYKIYASSGPTTKSVFIYPQVVPGSGSISLLKPADGTSLTCSNPNLPSPIMQVSYSWASHIAGAPGGTSPYRVIVHYLSGTGSQTNTFNHSTKSGSYSYYTYPCPVFTKGSNA